MSIVITQPTELAHWYSIIADAQASADIFLQTDCESYLVFLLLRFCTQPELANSVIAEEFLKSEQLIGSHRLTCLQIVGDKCLLFAGLFPERAQRKRVNPDYFINMGRTAYGQVSHGVDDFPPLNHYFQHMTVVLQSLRQDKYQHPLYRPNLDRLIALGDQITH